MSVIGTAEPPHPHRRFAFAKQTARRRWAAILLLAALPACDPACLAQTEAFSGLRKKLIVECCACLADAETAAVGATCGVPTLDVDGGVLLPDDAGPVADGDPNHGIACLCDGTRNSCIDALSGGEAVHLVGACVTPGDAPCDNACRGVLTFDPLVPAP